MLHGDAFDAAAEYHRLIDALGDHACAAVVHVNMLSSRMRRGSFAGYAKRKLTTALRFIRDFEHAVVRGVRERGCRSVVCGHIHAAPIRHVDGVIYVNCGDWVDSCTAAVEHQDGWMDHCGLRLPLPGLAPAMAPSQATDGSRRTCNCVPGDRPAKLRKIAWS